MLLGANFKSLYHVVIADIYWGVTTTPLLGLKKQLKTKPMITLTYLTQKECRTSKLLGVLCLFTDLILTLLISTL